MKNNLKPGDDVYWWMDHDPGNPEVGPQPDIYPEHGTFVRYNMGTIIVSVEDWPPGTKVERKISPSWLLSEEEVATMKAEIEAFCAGDPPWMTED